MNHATARAVVAPVHPGYPVAEVRCRTGGEVSAVYEIRGADGVRPLIIKVYTPRWRPKLVKEVYIYRLLARHGIRSVPRVLHAAPYGTPELPAAHIVMTLLPGRPLAEVGEASPSVYRQMGALLAAVHRIGFDEWGYVTTRVVDSRPTNTAYMTDQFARRLHEFRELGGDPAVAEAVARHLDRHAARLAACAAPVLCHNDFHQGNVLVDGGTVTGFVDVEGVVAADPLLDIARTDYYALRDNPAGRAEFFAGYSTLPPSWAERVALYQLHHALELWNWATHLGKPGDRSRALHDLESLLGNAPSHASLP